MNTITITSRLGPPAMIWQLFTSWTTSTGRRYKLWGAALIATILVPLLPAPAVGIPITSDPADDTFGAPKVAHDIALIDSQVSPTAITFSVEFYDAIAPPSAFAANSVVGFLDIDTDQNASTGSQSNTSRFDSDHSSQLGIEFHVDLFSERFDPGMAEVVDTSTMEVVGTVPVVFGFDRFTLEVPLELLADDGLVNYSFIAGDFQDMSDRVPNSGFASTIPEPATVTLWILAAAIGLPRPAGRHGSGQNLY